MGLEVSHHQRDAFSLRHVDRQDVFEARGPLDVGTPIRDLHMAPTVQRGKAPQPSPRAVACIGSSRARRLTRRSRQRLTRFDHLGLP